MNQSNQIDQLATALAAAQGEFQAVPRSAENPFFKSKYADLPAVVLAASPILSKHGLSVSQLPDFDGANDLLTTTILHKSGQWMQATARLHLAKADPQAQGSATTYMRRYAYSGALGIVTDVDDDGQAATRSHQDHVETSRRSQGTVRRAPQQADPETGEIHEPPRASPNKPASDKQVGAIKSLARKFDLTPNDLQSLIQTALGRTTTGWDDLTSADASKVIDQLKSYEADETVPTSTVPMGLLPGEEPF
jgi:hypothetical protein